MTAPASTLALKTAFNTTNPSLQPLRDGRVTIDGVAMQQMPSQNIIAVFRHMCRTLEYDITEMAVVTYFTARHYGLPMTAIPVFPASRVEEGGGIFVRQGSGVKTARDLEGKTVGMRSWAVTPCTWQKAYLQQQGLDLNKVHWICHDEEHVEALNRDVPRTIEYRLGADIPAMLAAGEIDAAIGVPVQGVANIVPLVPDSRERGIEAFKKDGIYRLIHLMVVKNSVLQENPWVLEATYAAFRASKQAYLESLADKAPAQPWEDPLPMGLSKTRASLEVLMQHAVAQGTLPAPLDIDEIFPGSFEL